MDRGNRIFEPTVTLIGFGEAAQAFVAGWHVSRPSITTHGFDIKTQSDSATATAKRAEFHQAGTVNHRSLADAVKAGEPGPIISLVTASQALSAAVETSMADLGGRLFLDGNSCSPQTKRKAADRINGAMGRYVDVAVMSPVHPRLHRTPTLVSGPHAEAARQVMTDLDMDVAVVDGPVGAAAAIKLCRSIMVKGIESLVAEMLAAARTLGVERIVLESLDASHGHAGTRWESLSANALQRMMEHGERRAEEMEAAVDMLADMGLPHRMSEATARWQRQVAKFRQGDREADARIPTEFLVEALSPPRDRAAESPLEESGRPPRQKRSIRSNSSVSAK